MKTLVALCLCSCLVLSAAVASAKPGSAASTPQFRIAVASMKVNGVTHTARVKVDARGKIVPWTEKKWAQITPGKGKSEFFWLGQNRETSGIEWERAGKAKNGYSLVTVGTTADSVTLGVSLKDGKGFFNYRDLGSGNGNHKYELTVKESKSRSTK
jgi:hypothetical protein